MSEALPGLREDNPELLEKYGHVVKTGEPVYFEVYVKSLRVWLAVSAYRPRKNHFIAIFDNITERKNVEKALRDSEQRFKGFFNLSNDGAMVHGMLPDGTPTPFVEVNEAACQMLGYSREELLTMTPMDIDAPHAADDIPVTPTIMSGGRVVFERTHIAKDGRRIPVEISSRIIELDEKPYAISMVRDITERKLAKVRLEKTVNQRTEQLNETNAQLAGEIVQRRHIEEALKTSNVFLEIANRDADVRTLLDDFIGEIKKFTQCSAVAIRLLDTNGNIPYQAHCGFIDGFYEKENALSIKSDACMCINVIKGTTAPILPYYTEGGSFFMNATTRFLAAVPETEKGITRNVCNAFGYESVALIPIRSGTSIVGLIHLADEKEGMVPLDNVQQLERIAIQLGSSLERAWLTEKLKSSEEYFRSLYEKLPVGYQSLDADGYFLEVNPAWLKILGYAKDEIIGRWFGDLLIPEQVALFKERFPQFKAKGEVETEFVMVRKDGSRALISVTGKIDYDQHGNVRKTHCLMIDITERRRIEKEIYLLASMPLVNPNPIMRASPKGDLLFANNGSRPLLESWNTRIGGLLPEYWRDEIWSIFATGLMKDFEIEVAGRFYDLKIFPNPELGTLNIYGLDITRRKHIAHELEVSEANYRMLFDNASDAMILWEMEEGGVFRVKEANKVALERYGYSRDELIGMAGNDLNTVDSYKNVQVAVKQMMDTGYATYELTHVTKDGRLIPSEVYGHSFHLSGKTVVLAVVRDISERKKADDEKALYQRQLEKMVEDRTRSLTEEVASRHEAEKEINQLYQHELALREALQKQIKERVFFTRALVHELKTPLTPLLGSSEMLTNLAREEPFISLSQNVYSGAVKLRKRIDQLLDLAKGEVGLLKLKLAPVDLAALISETATYVSPSAVKRRLAVRVELPVELPIVQGDRDYLHRVLLNLLDNALKYTHGGGQVTIGASVDEGMVTVEVRDTGIGIPPEKQDRLFIPYSRVVADEASFAGLGLGLALCKTIIELHGGRIWIESEKDKGTIVHFTLPTGRDAGIKEKGDVVI